MTVDKDLPALRDLRRRLEAELTRIIAIAQSQMESGKVTALVFSDDIEQRRAELMELDYVIRQNEPHGITITPAVAAALMIIMMSSVLLLASLVYTLAGAR